MSSHPKLVDIKAQRKLSLTGPRPFKVFYSGGPRGSCKTLASALATAARHLLDGDSKRANIVLEGQVLADLDRGGYQLQITWRRAAKGMMPKEAVK